MRCRSCKAPRWASWQLLCILGGLFGGFSAWAIGPLLNTLAGTELAGLVNGPTRLSLIAFGQERSIYDAPTIALFVMLLRDCDHARGALHLEPRHPPGSRLGLRLSRCVACHAIYRVELQPAAAPRL